jgi:hypothetical protein
MRDPVAVLDDRSLIVTAAGVSDRSKQQRLRAAIQTGGDISEIHRLTVGDTRRGAQRPTSALLPLIRPDVSAGSKSVHVIAGHIPSPSTSGATAIRSAVDSYGPGRRA